MLIKAGDFIFPVDFINFDIEEAHQLPVIFVKPFLSISQALLYFETNDLILRIEDKQ